MIVIGLPYSIHVKHVGHLSFLNFFTNPPKYQSKYNNTTLLALIYNFTKLIVISLRWQSCKVTFKTNKSHKFLVTNTSSNGFDGLRIFHGLGPA